MQSDRCIRVVPYHCFHIYAMSIPVHRSLSILKMCPSPGRQRSSDAGYSGMNYSWQMARQQNHCCEYCRNFHGCDCYRHFRLQGAITVTAQVRPSSGCKPAHRLSVLVPLPSLQTLLSVAGGSIVFHGIWDFVTLQIKSKSISYVCQSGYLYCHTYYSKCGGLFRFACTNGNS